MVRSPLRRVALLTHSSKVLALAASCLTLFAVVACGDSTVEVEGERSQSRSDGYETDAGTDYSGGSDTESWASCPEDDCSDQTPWGLTFVGTGFWDDMTPHLGPIVVGGTFDLGLRRSDDGRLPSFEVTTTNPRVLTAEVSSAPYQQSGGVTREVDGHIVLEGRSAGTVYVRVLDEDGLLMDRISLDIEEIDEIQVMDMDNPDATSLTAGDSVLIGVRLLVGGSLQRAIDQDVTLSVNGIAQPENLYWDCFTYTVPEDRDEVTFTATSGGESTEVTFDIVQ